MEDIIQAIDRELLKSELTPEKFLRKTNKAGNEVYVTTAKDSPNIMDEIARLRELSFRSAGGGTGQEKDVDEYDLMDDSYIQLFVWDPDSEEIIGGYRYIHGRNVKIDAEGQPVLVTSKMYFFSETFVSSYLPNTIELGRSFVHPDYQSSKMGAKSLFALDNLWDGLGAVIVSEPDVKYLFGKVTVYPHYDARARDLLFSFMTKQFPDPDKLVTPIDPFPVSIDAAEADEIYVSSDYKGNYKILNKEVRKIGVNIPPLVNSYMALSPNMKVFGYAICHGFGEVIECGILIPVDQMTDAKKKRHIESFLEED